MLVIVYANKGFFSQKKNINPGKGMLYIDIRDHAYQPTSPLHTLIHSMH
jgi:hypothetical protein